MTADALEIKEINICKSSGEINQAMTASGQFKNARNDLDISYSVLKDSQGLNDTLSVSLKCNIYTNNEADFASVEVLRANVEVIYQILLGSTFNPKYLDNIMHFIWPYLRLGAAHQLQVINLGFVGEKLPLDIVPLREP